MALEIVEEAGRVDFASLIDLMRLEWPEDWGAASDERMLEVFEESSDPRFDVNKYLVADGRRVGWYRYTRWPRGSTTAETAHTLDIVLMCDHQGKGLGRMLMDDLISDCRDRGYRKLLSRTIEGNLKSNALHRSAGFRESFRNGSDIVWELSLVEIGAGA